MLWWIDTLLVGWLLACLLGQECMFRVVVAEKCGLPFSLVVVFVFVMEYRLLDRIMVTMV